MSQEYEAERPVSRDEAATALRQLADGIAAGSVVLDAETGPAAVDVATDLALEIELEEADDEVELEVELEWSPGESGGSAITELDGVDGPTIDLVGPATDPVGPATDPASPADESGSKARFELFRDKADEWRWRLRHRNGNVIADSGEGYDRKAGAINGLESVKSNAPLAVVDEQPSE